MGKKKVTVPHFWGLVLSSLTLFLIASLILKWFVEAWVGWKMTPPQFWSLYSLFGFALFIFLIDAYDIERPPKSPEKTYRDED